MTDIRPQSDVSGGLRDRAEETATTAKDHAATVADSARNQASEVATATAEQVRAVASDAKLEAQRVMRDSRRQLMDQANEQTTRLAGSVRDVSTQLQTVMRGGQPPQGLVGDLAAQAADASSRLADHLEAHGPEQLLNDVRSFARRRPGAFLLGALGAGVLAGRMMRAVDTSELVDAAKAGAGKDDHGASAQLSGEGPTALGRAGEPAGGAFPGELASAVRP
jgi:hypothetical protein